ncbi:uncharacterized protein LOC115545467 isoform X1 [Gadus morhua]|uniref:uncharacterized protein LOC115545467 isoform X1 n=2 Tax=Gadus morhua TaxID=8049 RepID=UPI0011B47F97|nr:uncharacterized protein LOC115545467 isoform X1 [Gadus morhua]
MAATVVDVFLNQSMVAFLDKDRTMPYQGMVAANIHSADCTCTDTCNIKPTAPLPVNCGEKSITLPVNKGFTKKQTLFLIHLMRIHLEVKGEGTAKSIHALNRRLKFGKKSKKLRRWEEIAGKLAKQFGEHFQQLKVGRKWFTLVEAYKRVKDNVASTGRGPGRFKFYKEMDELLGGNHDVDPPVVGSDCAGVVVRRPNALRMSNRARSPAQPTSSSSLSPASSTASPAPVRDPTRPPDTPRSRKRSDSTSSPAAADGATSSVSPTRAPSPAQSTSSSSPSPSSSSASPPAVRDPTRASDTPSLRKRTREDDVLAYLERSDAAAMAASQRRHEESLTEMRALREDRRKFLQLFSSMVDKM